MFNIYLTNTKLAKIREIRGKGLSTFAIIPPETGEPELANFVG
jgi:hypothetical protein